MVSSGKASSAPGLALQTLLRQAKPAVLRKVIGPSTVEVLEGLDPDLVAGERLGELASRLIDASEALHDPAKRDQIVSILPLPKARELAKRLAVDEGKDLYGNLRDRTGLRRQYRIDRIRRRPQQSKHLNPFCFRAKRFSRANSRPVKEN